MWVRAGTSSRMKRGETQGYMDGLKSDGLGFRRRRGGGDDGLPLAAMEEKKMRNRYGVEVPSVGSSDSTQHWLGTGRLSVLF